MSDYTPTPEAVEAFKAAWHEADAEGDAGNRVLRGLAAAGPIIAAEVRERVAREIEARVKGEALPPDESTTGRTIRILREDGFTEAARIARGEGS